MKTKALIFLFAAARLGALSLASAQVQQAWVTSPTNFYGESAAVSVDSSGNVYITGSATAKYDPDGHQMWQVPVSGVALALDAAGNVHVAGPGFAASKYDPNGTLRWRASYRGGTNVTDYVKAIAVDAAGNVYLTGTTDCDDPPCYEGIHTNSDYATVKYDSNGTQLWVARYDGPDHTTEQANAMAVDSSGNVYVTGLSRGASSGIDYATVKYDPSGKQLWAARYDGNGYDSATAIAVDTSGDVYVTGYSGSYPDYDYATIKYDPDGNQLWVARYNNAKANDDDEAIAIAVDKAGNVYVTGYSVNDDYPGTTDFATIKYDSNGNKLWIARYDHTNYEYEYPAAMVLDNDGNVYITGVAGSDSRFYYGGGRTVRYDPYGNELWEVSSPGPAVTGLAVDAAGNVYVTGYYPGSEAGPGSALTAKYVQAADLPPTIIDQPQSQTVPVGSNVSFAVRVTGTTPFSYQWLFDDKRIGAAINATLTLTNAQATNSGNYQVLVSNPAGAATSIVARLTVQLRPPPILTQQVQEAWVARYDGPARSNDVPHALALDGAGNVYVTGSSAAANGLSDYATVKYDGSGNQLWAARYNGPARGDDSAAAIAADSLGNVYVAGSSTGTNGSADYATARYDSNGTQIWVKRYDGPAHADDSASAILSDGAGNTYVTGLSYGTNGVGGVATVKYDANGNQLWVARYDGPNPATSASANSMAVDIEGNVYVNGFSGSYPNFDYATIKYGADGNQVWVARYNGPANKEDQAGAIAVDTSGNVYVTGWSEGLGTGFDCVTIKYDPNGNRLWVARYNGPANLNDYGNALAADAAGNVYVIGSTEPDDSPVSDFLTIKYSPDGDQLWVARYNGPGNDEDEATALAVDHFGSVYVAGYTFAFTGSDYVYSDYLTVKYDANGNEIWTARYDGTGNRDDGISDLAVDAGGNVYVTGYSFNGENYDFATINYVQTPIRPRLAAPFLLSNGSFQFTLIGEAGRSYTIEVSEDLNNWSTVTNFISAAGTSQITDGAAPGLGQRLYRAVTP